MSRIIKSIFKFFVLIGLLSALLFAYNAYRATSGLMDAEGMQNLEGPQKMISYGRKAISMALGLASPILSGLGINVDEIVTEDSDIITDKMQESSDKLTEAMNKLKNQ